ncbi:hypothetical protein ACKWTF_013462 [Chironomus riparius]
MNFKYSHNCLHNESIRNYIDEFRLKYNEIQDITDDDLLYFKQHRAHGESIARVCELKRNKARSVTDYIHLIADACVKNENIRKKFTLNTLLMLEFELDFVCSLSESVFTTIYKNHVSTCIDEKMGLLDKCRENSFNVLFFDKRPEQVPWIQLINGAICNFDYNTMKNCAVKPLESCNGASEALSYLLDVIKRNSLCFKRKNLADIIENSSEDASSIVD